MLGRLVVLVQKQEQVNLDNLAITNSLGQCGRHSGASEWRCDDVRSVLAMNVTLAGLSAGGPVTQKKKLVREAAFDQPRDSGDTYGPDFYCIS